MSNFCFKYNSTGIYDNSSLNLVMGVLSEMILVKGTNSFIICDEYAYILNLIKEKLNINLSFVINNSSTGGQLFKNGSWSGFLECIQKKSIDAILRPYVYDEERSTLLDFPYLMPTGKLLAILSRPRTMIDIDLLTIFHVFRLDVWILIMISFLILTILNSMKSTDIKTKFYIASDYLALLIGKGLCIKSYHNKYFISMWALSALVITNYFVNDIQAVLVSVKEERINTFQQLLDREDISILAVERTYSYGALVKNFNGPMNRIKKIKNKDYYSVKTLISLLEHKSVIVAEDMTLNNIIHHFHQYNLVKTGDDDHFILYGYPISRYLNSTYKSKLKNMYRSIYQFGIQAYNYRKAIKLYDYLDNYNNISRNIMSFDSYKISGLTDSERFVVKINNTFICLSILGMGFMISIIFILCEISANKLKYIE